MRQAAAEREAVDSRRAAAAAVTVTSSPVRSSSASPQDGAAAARAVASDGVPQHRIIARNARFRFVAIDLSGSLARRWAELSRVMGDSAAALCYNQTRADRVCPICATQYLPLAAGAPAAHAALERIEEERRVSGICSAACWLQSGSSLDGMSEAQARRGDLQRPPPLRTAADAVGPPPNAGSVFVVTGESPELDGCIAIVLSGVFSTPERLAVAVLCGAGASPIHLSLLRSSLVPLPAPSADALHWALHVAISRTKTFVLAIPIPNLVSGDHRIGDCDTCTTFVDAVMNAVRPPAFGPHPPSRLFTRDAIQGILRTPGHTIYACRFDAVGHHFILEVNEGHGRLLQSYVRSTVTYGPGMPSEVTGFLAREWVAAVPDAEWAAPLVAAHRRWGGGRILPPAELAALLIAYADLQQLGDAAVAELLPQLPLELQDAEAAVAKRNELRLARAMSTAARLIELEPSPLDHWSARLIHEPSTSSFLRAPGSGEMHVFTNGAYTGAHPFRAVISAPLATRIASTWVDLTGQVFTGVQYVALLHHRHWRMLQGMPGSATPAGVPVGWGIAETIPWK